MSKTFLNGQTETRIYLDESSAADFLDSEVKLAYNRSYHDVAGAVMEVYEQFYETTTPYTYAEVADQQEYTIASSLIKPTRVEINYNPTTSGSVASRAIPIKSNEVRGNLANTNTSATYDTPAYYIHGSLSAQKIGFVPVPHTADTTGQSISVWGIDLPADLSADGDNVNIPYADRFAYLVALRAAAQLLRKGQQEENNAQNYINEYQKGLVQMKSFLKDRQEDGVQMIQDALGEDTDFTAGGIF
ncbi:hypothetical protein M0R04_13525 [Candidatus Dojkabacteria bacterium]|jgi:hypothetical protein|nr:hypothetical protein [Candidatus Dojkabacteria bacterium]